MSRTVPEPSPSATESFRGLILRLPVAVYEGQGWHRGATEPLLVIHEADHRLRFDLTERNPVTGPISRNRLLGSLTEAASWPGATRSTVVMLATALVAARADAEGSRYFQDLSERNPHPDSRQLSSSTRFWSG
jgi:hypothetical protein